MVIVRKYRTSSYWVICRFWTSATALLLYCCSCVISSGSISICSIRIPSWRGGVVVFKDIQRSKASQERLQVMVSIGEVPYRRFFRAYLSCCRGRVRASKINMAAAESICYRWALVGVNFCHFSVGLTTCWDVDAERWWCRVDMQSGKRPEPSVRCLYWKEVQQPLMYVSCIIVSALLMFL